MKKRRRRNRVIVIISILLIAIIFSYQQNNHITITQLNIDSNQIPDNFDGYKILQISDLHGKEFGKNQKSIVKKIINEAPDVIFVTGDTIDSEDYNGDVSIQLLSQIIEVAPIYFVTGNHEAWSIIFPEFEKQLQDLGVIVLRNDSKLMSVEDSHILVIGVDDPQLQVDKDILTQIKELTADKEYYSILLSHRPELLKVYAEHDIDLVFSGHAHGGQIRLPFIGGLLAPSQGWLPQYTSGIYQENNTKMIVSRGLGNSRFPQRVLNRPELVVVTISKRQ